MRYSTTKKPAGSFFRFRRRVWTIGLLGTGAVAAAVTASAAELPHHLLPTRYVEAPVEPAPPNAGFYPTRWNRWDSERAYLPGIRKLQGPPVTPPAAAPAEELPPPNGSPAAPAQPPVPKRDGDTAPMPPAETPKPIAPPTKPGELPPLPNADSPDPAPRQEIPPIPNSGLSIPPPAAPDLLRTPPAVDPSGSKPPPLEQPRERQPEVEPRKVPEPAPLPLPAPELKIPNAPQEKEPEKKEPEDKLFEAPPRSGEKDDKQGSDLPERPSFVVTQARGQWVAKGRARPSQKLTTPAAVLQGSELKVMDCSAGGQCIESHAGRPAPLPANDSAIPLTSIRPVRDASVRPVNWTEPAGDNPTLPNPLRQR